MRVADVLGDDAGAQSGDLRPLGCHSSPLAARLAVGGLEQIIPFGRSTDGNTGEQVVAQIGGSGASSDAEFATECDGANRPRLRQRRTAARRHSGEGPAPGRAMARH